MQLKYFYFVIALSKFISLYSLDQSEVWQRRSKVIASLISLFEDEVKSKQDIWPGILGPQIREAEETIRLALKKEAWKDAALGAYNVIRSTLEQPVARTFNEIDPDWYYQALKKNKENGNIHRYKESNDYLRKSGIYKEYPSTTKVTKQLFEASMNPQNYIPLLKEIVRNALQCVKKAPSDYEAKIAHYKNLGIIEYLINRLAGNTTFKSNPLIEYCKKQAIAAYNHLLEIQGQPQHIHLFDEINDDIIKEG